MLTRSRKIVSQQQQQQTTHTTQIPQVKNSSNMIFSLNASLRSNTGLPLLPLTLTLLLLLLSRLIYVTPWRLSPGQQHTKTKKNKMYCTWDDISGHLPVKCFDRKKNLAKNTKEKKKNQNDKNYIIEALNTVASNFWNVYSRL